jgi:NAD(P)-dependent dehydrogenase (short-subunit alcohol dehydrogenase family)
MSEFSQSRKKYFFTGGTSGLGKAAVLSLLESGAEIIVASRSEEKAKDLREEAAHRGLSDSDLLKFVSCDLSSFDSIRSACAEIKSNSQPLDGIINNAGVWCFAQQETEDGIEKTLQVNLLAPYLIVQLLKSHLKPGARLIQTASALHQGSFDVENPELKGKYSGFRAYRQSKLGTILLTRWWAASREYDELYAYAQHPGLVSTELGREGNWFVRQFFQWFGKSPEKGAETLLFLTQTPNDHLENGAHYKNEKPKRTDTSTSRSMEWAEKVAAVCKRYLPEG